MHSELKIPDTARNDTKSPPPSLLGGADDFALQGGARTRAPPSKLGGGDLCHSCPCRTGLGSPAHWFAGLSPRPISRSARLSIVSQPLRRKSCAGEPFSLMSTFLFATLRTDRSLIFKMPWFAEKLQPRSTGGSRITLENRTLNPMYIFRLLILCLSLFLVGTPQQGLSQTTSNPFVEAARKREAAAKVVDVTFKMREIRPKGSPVPGAGWALGGAKEGSVLETDLVLESTNRLVFQDSMVRFESNRPVWNVGSGKALPTEVLSVSKNGSAKTFYVKGRGTEKWPSGTFGPDASNMHLKIVYLFPLFSAYRGRNRTLGVYSADSFKPSGAKQPIGGNDCLEYAQTVGSDARLSFFVAPRARLYCHPQGVGKQEAGHQPDRCQL